MSIARTVAVAVVALGLGVALGLVLGGGVAEDRPEPGPNAAFVPPDPAAPTESPRPDRGDAPPRRPAREHVAAPIEVSDLVERAVASIETPEVPEGDGRIDGRVTTRDGKPIPGIEVTAALVGDPTPRGRPWNELPIAGQVTWLVRTHRLKEASTRTTTTDADGRYAFENLPREPHSITGSSDQYRITYTGGYRLQVEPDATVDLMGEAIVKVSVALTLADGTEPEEARIVFTATSGSTWGVRWTPATRTFDVVPGTHRVDVTSGELKELTASVPSVTLAFGETPEELALQLLSRPGVAGRLVLPEGAPATSASVSAELIGVDTTPESVAAGRQRATAHQQGDYVFSIPDLVPGRYLVVAWNSRQGGVLASQEVEVGDEMAIVDLVAAGPTREGHLEIVLRGPDGEPLTAGQVQLRFKGGRRNSTVRRPAIARPDGSIWVRHIEASRVAADGTYTAIVSHPSFGHAEREYRLAPAARVEVTFEEPAFVDVTVAGASPELVAAGLAVAIGDAQRRNVSSGKGLVDAEGHVRIGPVQPGAASLTATVTTTNRTMVVATQALHVRGGDNTATFAMPSLHTLRVEWSDPAAGRGQRVWLRGKKRGPGQTNIHQNVPDSGRVVFRFVPAGEYDLRAGRVRRVVTVPGTDLVRF